MTAIQNLCIALCIVCLAFNMQAQEELIPVGEGWAGNSVNVTVFRKNSLVTHNDTQFIAYYDSDGFLTLGKRKTGAKDWTISTSRYKGNIYDAHNSISIMIDGDGYLHVSWDHHGHPLRYAKGIEPYSLELGDMQPMTGQTEENVTYPEFFRMPDGDLIFIYRDGQSGRGNLVLNHYSLEEKRWTQVQQNLINGEMQRNAYWQACIDKEGVIHLSWVWRETWDVESNHDLCYAKSYDGGKSWKTSDEKKYALPITAGTAEYICRIPENSELINQTSMTTDRNGNPYIATYWREQDGEVPQYHVVYKSREGWKTSDLAFRKTPFLLSGGGTKRIPISRPQLVVSAKANDEIAVYLIFRDEERGNKVSLAACENIENTDWKISDLSSVAVGSWEPSYDTELWKNKGKLNIFVQNADQVDGEGKSELPAQPVYVLEVNL